MAQETAGGMARDPRIDRTRAHVLGHARSLLADEGPDAVTYSELATRARVTRQTLYRHWPSREGLFVDLVLEQAMDAMPEASGTPEDIVGAFLRRLRDDMDDPSNAGPLTALIAQADHDPTSRAALHDTVAQIRGALNQLLEPSGLQVGPEEYARLCGPVIFQRFLTRERVTDQFIDDLVAGWSSTR